MDLNRHIYNYTNVWGSDHDIWNKIKIAAHSFHREHLRKLGYLLSSLTGVGYCFSKRKYDWDHNRWLHFYWRKEERIWDTNLSEDIDVEMKFSYTWKQPFSLKKNYWHTVYKGEREFGYVAVYKKYIWQDHWVRQKHFVNDMDKIFEPYENYLASGGVFGSYYEYDQYEQLELPFEDKEKEVN